MRGLLALPFFPAPTFSFIMFSLHANRFRLISIIRKCASVCVYFIWLPLDLLRLTNRQGITYFKLIPDMLNSSNLRVLSNALQAHKNSAPNPLVQFIESSSSCPYLCWMFIGNYWFGNCLPHSQCSSWWSIVYGIMWLLFCIRNVTNPYTKFAHFQSIASIVCK